MRINGTGGNILDQIQSLHMCKNALSLFLQFMATEQYHWSRFLAPHVDSIKSGKSLSDWLDHMSINMSMEQLSSTASPD